MKYEINPCLACTKKFESKNCNINNINNCCYDTLAAFSGATSVNSIRNIKAAENCKACLSEKMKTLGPFPSGRNFCNFQLSPPPLWNQTSHYLPSLLDESSSVKEALGKCYRMCESKDQYPETCKETCYTDSLAVVPLPDEKPVKPNAAKAPEEKKKIDTASIVMAVIVLIIIILLIIYGLKTLSRN